MKPVGAVAEVTPEMEAPLGELSRWMKGPVKTPENVVESEHALLSNSNVARNGNCPCAFIAPSIIVNGESTDGDLWKDCKAVHIRP